MYNTVEYSTEQILRSYTLETSQQAKTSGLTFCRIPGGETTLDLLDWGCKMFELLDLCCFTHYELFVLVHYYIFNHFYWKYMSRPIDGAQLTSCCGRLHELACGEHGPEQRCASAVKHYGRRDRSQVQSSLLTGSQAVQVKYLTIVVQGVLTNPVHTPARGGARSRTLGGKARRVPGEWD